METKEWTFRDKPENEERYIYASDMWRETYKDISYVKAEVTSLAAQASFMIDGIRR